MHKKRYAQQKILSFSKESAMTRVNTDNLLKFLFWQAAALKKD